MTREKRGKIQSFQEAPFQQVLHLLSGPDYDLWQSDSDSGIRKGLVKGGEVTVKLLLACPVVTRASFFWYSGGP